MRLSRFFALLASISLFGAAPALAQTGWNSVTLHWTTPGDDGMLGTATQFDLRYSTSPITGSNFGNATRWTATPTPASPGTDQTVTVTGLTPSTTYYFAIKTGDDVPNWAPISNVLSATTSSAPDVTRPAPLAISVSGLTDTTATIGWTAVGDDSLTGTASSYDVRYSTSPITSSNWASATQATGEAAPTAAGTAQSHVVRSLSRQVTYYFAVKVADEAGNVSALSNVRNATTPDTMAPAAITNLSASFVWIGWSGLATREPRTVGVSGR